MKRKDEFALQNVGGENLLVPIGAKVMDLNGIITLNDTAVFVWEMLAEDCTLDQLAAAVAKQFGIDEAAAALDVKTFLDEITELGLLQ